MIAKSLHLILEKCGWVTCFCRLVPREPVSLRVFRMLVRTCVAVAHMLDQAHRLLQQRCARVRVEAQRGRHLHDLRASVDAAIVRRAGVRARVLDGACGWAHSMNPCRSSQASMRLKDLTREGANSTHKLSSKCVCVCVSKCWRSLLQGPAKKFVYQGRGGWAQSKILHQGWTQQTGQKDGARVYYSRTRGVGWLHHAALPFTRLHTRAGHSKHRKV